jgi:hypothetical protein
MRGIPTQAARVMRRNPNLQSPILFMGFLLLLGCALREVQAAPHVKLGFLLESQIEIRNVKHKSYVLSHFNNELDAVQNQR